jgi:RNA polymerase-interacting CarD/CdnL/TRCF family regulator
MTANELANQGIVTQLAIVYTMLPKVKELIDQQAQEIEALKQQLELAEWDEDAWKKFKQDNYEVINLGDIKE